MRREIAFHGGVSAGRSGDARRPQTLPKRETEFRRQRRSQTEFRNEKKPRYCVTEHCDPVRSFGIGFQEFVGEQLGFFTD